MIGDWYATPHMLYIRIHFKYGEFSKKKTIIHKESAQNNTFLTKA